LNKIVSLEEYLLETRFADRIVIEVEFVETMK
jgi:hypothetical protein